MEEDVTADAVASALIGKV